MDVFAQMHRDDLNNNTDNLGICPHFVKANLSGKNIHITMGAPASLLEDINDNKVMVMLLVVNKKEHERLKLGTES